MINSQPAANRKALMRLSPQAVAWLVVSISLIGFCSLSTAGAMGLYWFLFDSPVSLNVKLVVSQGNVILQAPNGEQLGVYDTQSVNPQTTVWVKDSNSQGVLEFRDSYSSQVVATITLTGNSQLTLETATRPRFEVSHHPYRLTLGNAAGQLLITAGPGERAFEMDVSTPAGTAKLTNDGVYTVSTDQNSETHAARLNVFNQGGEAWLMLPSTKTVKVWPNTIETATVGTDDVLTSDSPYTLLVSGLFAGHLETLSNPASLPTGWQCSTEADSSEPAGIAQRSANFENGGLHLWRVGTGLSHGETSCLIYPNGPDGWLDTTNYRTVRLHVRFKLLAHDPNTHSLPVQDVPLCGVQATECPVMLEIKASTDPTDPNQALQVWHHGFYAISDPNAAYPFICDTCRRAHEQVNPEVWYYYDSGDLRQQFASGALFIKQISVYASGHQYDAVIGEISLLGGP